MLYNKRLIKSVSLTLIVVMASQLLVPGVAMALTTGPSQPEVQSFEPVGTTDMVDMFTGDFVYNIPLMDVEGYPVNISYHGGVSMEQEASWVGLGWNINPGVINRTVRGIPDDFNGDTLQKDLHIKDEKILRVGIGGGVELFGVGDPALNISADIATNINISNYKGVSCDFSFGGGVNVFHSISAGVNIGVGSQTGASIDYNAGLSLATSDIISKDMAGGVGINIGQGYSTRSGLKNLDISISPSASVGGNSYQLGSYTANIPIGIQNYIPVITNSSTMNSIYGRIKPGGELFWVYIYGNINAMGSTMHYNDDGSKDSYGYLYAQNANTNSIMDFTRDKDGLFNKTMQYLPPGNMTYDIYSVSGQGTGGVFRPFRNDFGSVYDPVTTSTTNQESLSAEAGIGWNVEIGGDDAQTETDITSGPWSNYQRGFTSKTPGSVYENTYFKQAGELTTVDPQYFSDINGIEPLTPDQTNQLPLQKPNSTTTRDARGNLMYYLTAEDAMISGVGSNPYIVNYTDTTGFANSPTPPTVNIPRDTTGLLSRHAGQISEITQVQKDGKRYVYGIPAMNYIQKEATFSVDPPNSTDMANGLVSYTPGQEDSKSNNKGIDNYYSATVTPSYAHSYLLTSVLSADYVDVTGDGPTDDDLGSYTKFNYSLKEPDYRWRAPFDAGKAQYNPGFWSDTKDDKGSYLSGSREEWMLHSIETKNFVAEFYTSKRNDAMGMTDPIVTSGKYAIAPYNSASAQAASSYKLDSIKLYNKHDRFIHGNNAIPIKTVFFSYTYSLCQGVPNFRTGTSDTAKGKLTLQKIYMRYGNSQRSMISPYQFTYSNENPTYSLANKDRWGGYKPNNASFTNYEYPYVDQNDPADTAYASAWSLTQIKLPSGGLITASYEPDDYAFVQNLPADEMFMVQGVGNSPDFNPGSQLYANQNSPYLYAYFKRRQSSENPSLSFAQNYLNGQNTMYFNFNVQLTNNQGSYEQIKGYANILDINQCPSNSAYGYIKFAPVTPTGGGANLNPVTYTAINVGRYNLPQIVFPGNDPNLSDLQNVLAGLKQAFNELVNVTKNPVVELVKSQDAKNINLAKSYIRLQSVGLMKKGGGQRVKMLTFSDSWNAMAAGNESTATYGKQYDYKVNDPTYGLISSGVASYEPIIGGDENPMRQPVPYQVQAGNTWPPNDPVDLYQELPIGESLFPPPVVGYSKVTVRSIHNAQGRSSQGIDVYQFYTARDFPAQVIPTAINSNSTYDFQLLSQKNLFTATQGYSLVFNDMHGKPKSVEHDVYVPTGGNTQTISYQIYNYKETGGQLDNNVNCLVYNPGTFSMVVQTKQLGIEEDVTIDTRQKNEDTHTNTTNANLNISTLPIFIPIVIPIPWAYSYSSENQNEFQSATVTKVVQRYGILDNVQTYNEGAVTTQQNELYDPQTGQVLVTSVNNEYHDKEYSVNIPAYWAENAMGPAYYNVQYQSNANDGVYIDSFDLGHFATPLPNVSAGDEVLVSYTDPGGTPYQNVAWIMGNRNLNDTSPLCTTTILPRYPTHTSGWNANTTINNVQFKVITSGRHNMLDKDIENYTMLDNPINASGILKDTITNAISIKGCSYSDNNTTAIWRYMSNPDTLNPFVTGQMGVYRLWGEYVYMTPRNYAGTTTRNAGLFSPISLYTPLLKRGTPCSPLDGFIMLNPGADPNWHLARTITKWSPNGKEIENLDAVGNYSTAIYGYNEELPVAVVSNAMQGQVLSDGFEDYALLNVITNLMAYIYSPFKQYFSLTPSWNSYYSILNFNNTSTPNIISTAAHTGNYCLQIPATANGTANVYSVSLPLTHSYTNISSYYEQISFTAANEYLPFTITPGKKYILSYWMRPASIPTNATVYTLPTNTGVSVNSTLYPPVTKSNIIDGWQQVEVTFTVPTSVSSVKLQFPLSSYVDDVRVFPSDANMKSFVYDPVNEKLAATLDENNFATIYEYDQEGNLVRTKKETEKGIMTISESRSANPKY